MMVFAKKIQNLREIKSRIVFAVRFYEKARIGSHVVFNVGGKVNKGPTSL